MASAAPAPCRVSAGPTTAKISAVDAKPPREAEPPAGPGGRAEARAPGPAYSGMSIRRLTRSMSASLARRNSSRAAPSVGRPICSATQAQSPLA